MKKAFVLLLTAISTLLQAQDKKTLLYEISGNGLEKPSYIYGTIHVICPKDFFMPEAAKTAVEKTEQLYLEIDMDDPQMMGKYQKISMLPDGKKINDYISAEDYTVLNDFMKARLKMSLDMFKSMKPLTLMSMMYMTAIDCPMPMSYEMEFMRLATKDKKEVLGLESIEFQASVFDKVPYDKQFKGIMDMAKKPEESAKEFQKLLAAYKSQDIDVMGKLIKDTPSEIKDFENDFLVNRNTSWIPTIETAIKAKPTFFAVGAAHLGGDTGVLKLLQNKGYRIKPVF